MWGKDSQFREYKHYLFQAKYDGGRIETYMFCGKHVVQSVCDFIENQPGLIDIEIIEPEGPAVGFHPSYGSCAVCQRRKESN